MGLFSKNKGSIEYLIVCLGNPGDKYENTRHNAGFLAGDYIVEKSKSGRERLRFSAYSYEVTIKDVKCLLLKPTTFMNLSGQAVQKAASFYKIPPERIIVIYDDIDLDVGKMRIRKKGSAGGHNGIKSIISCIGSQDFLRIRIGVGAKPDKFSDLADYVLSKFSKNEQETLRGLFEDIISALEFIVKGQTDKAMNNYN